MHNSHNVSKVHQQRKRHTPLRTEAWPLRTGHVLGSTIVSQEGSASRAQNACLAKVCQASMAFMWQGLC